MRLKETYLKMSLQRRGMEERPKESGDEKGGMVTMKKKRHSKSKHNV